MPADLAITRTVTLRPIAAIAADLGIAGGAIYCHVRHLAKIETATVDALRAWPNGRLILVTAINPTPPGDVRTTTTVGLGDALVRLGTGRRSRCASRRSARCSGARAARPGVAARK